MTLAALFIIALFITGFLSSKPIKPFNPNDTNSN